MDLREYSYILALVRFGSINRAAEALYISQPSLSVYIKRLEARIGLKLFNRVDGKLSLTAAGEKYVAYAERITALDAQLMHELEDLKTRSREEVVFGISSIRSAAMFPVLLPELKARHPHIKLKSVEGTSKELEALLRRGEIDLAVLSQHQALEGLEFHKLITKRICVVIPSAYAVCEKAEVTRDSHLSIMKLEYLRDCPFILLNKGMVLRRIADDLFSRAGYEPMIYSETTNSKTALSLSAAGIGLTLVWDTFFRYAHGEEYKGVRFFYLDYPVQFSDIVIAYPALSGLSRAARAFLDVLTNLDFNRDA